MDSAVPIRILLVEDNPGDIDLVRESLRDYKIPSALSVVSNGIDALDYLNKRGEYKNAKRPNLILLDLTLPIKDGRVVLKEVKNDSKLKDIPVVVLTSSEAELDVDTSYLEGASSYILKPVTYDRFQKMIDSLGDYWFEEVRLPKESGNSMSQVDSASKKQAVARGFQGPESVSMRDKKKPLGKGEEQETLLIEDNPGDVELIRELIKGEGIPLKLTVTDHLGSAIDLLGLNSNKFSLILLDLNLPDSVGLDSLLRTHKAAPGIPIVVLSDHIAESVQPEDDVSNMAKGFISKQKLGAGMLAKAIQKAF